MQTLSQIRQIFLDYADNNSFDQPPVELYEPINYILSLGGKRIRPLLTLLGHQLFRDDIEKSLCAAYAVEVFHNFTLLHDDIMDEAPLRRSQPTVHEKYDTNTAILSGDAMMILSYHSLSKVENTSKITALYQIMNKAAIEVCEGQQMDMNFETRSKVTIEEYLKMIEFKTAVLLGASIQMGACIADASKEDARHAYEFGRNIGIAFQIQDDILDTYGDPEKFGKKVGGDIVQNKKTYLAIKALQLANKENHETLKNLLNTPTTNEEDKIAAVKNLYNQLNIKAIAENKMEEYLKVAFQRLDAIAVPADRKTVLTDLANGLMNRQS